jgi:hypothetical protein
MELNDIIALIASVTIAVTGWVVAHGLSSRRELEQKKRELRVKYLREAYLNIANLCDRGEYPRDIANLQDALNDIQLFGEETQINLVGKVVTQLANNETANFNELLKQLRNEIRGHIGLNSLQSTRWYIRITSDK